jgi:hypothetical protein
MRIFLHVGPHKTGTTSVQLWMSKNSKHFLQTYGIYYPEVVDNGPGHAEIAWDTLGIHGRPVKPDLLRKVVESGASLGANAIFLSSEEFCMGLCEGTMENLASLNDYGTVELLVTLTPLADRVLAELANLILYRRHFDLTALEADKLCQERPGLRPNLLQELREAICPSRVHVILSQKQQPKVLFQALAQILGVRQPKEVVTANTRSSDTLTRLINFVNAELPDLTFVQSRDLASKFEHVLQEDGLADKMQPLNLPDDVKRFFDEIWDLQKQNFDGLQQAGEIELYPHS